VDCCFTARLKISSFSNGTLNILKIIFWLNGLFFSSDLNILKKEAESDGNQLLGKMRCGLQQSLSLYQYFTISLTKTYTCESRFVQVEVSTG
jgi:hypothetical protein